MNLSVGKLISMSSTFKSAILGAITSLIVAGSLLVGASPASADVLVNAPRARVCRHGTFKVGVWNDYNGGSRRYRINVFLPTGNRVFHHHGKATHTWRFWKIRAHRLGRYKTVYKSGRGASHPWRQVFHTRSHRC